VNGLRRDGIAVDRSPEALEVLLATNNNRSSSSSTLRTYGRTAPYDSFSIARLSISWQHLRLKFLGGCAVLTHFLIR
jgi:hypothetical protein